MNSDGNDQTNLTQTPTIKERSPGWSPDGNKLVYSQWKSGPVLLDTGPSEIFSINADGSGRTQLTHAFGSVHDRSPSWQPIFSAASISGRVTTPGGQGLSNATVSITDSQGVRRTATTSTFGFYSLTDIPTGESYTISVKSRRYRFQPREITLTGNLTDLDLIGFE